jgi:RNA polymerase sigma-70 factor (ECF subfamily)
MPIATADSSLDEAIAEFARLRPRLLGIASRIVGNWTEAEDVVQDAWLRWQLYDRTVVQNPAAFLVTTTTRLAMNAAQSARTRYETAVGRGLPELVDATDAPVSRLERSEALAAGIRVLLQRLSPTERAAYVLRQAFDYPYPQIAEVLQVTEANARQLVSRASKHLAVGRRWSASGIEHERLMHAFVAAAQRGDVTALENLFAATVRTTTAPHVGTPVESQADGRNTRSRTRDVCRIRNQPGSMARSRAIVCQQLYDEPRPMPEPECMFDEQPYTLSSSTR